MFTESSRGADISSVQPPQQNLRVLVCALHVRTNLLPLFRVVAGQGSLLRLSVQGLQVRGVKRA